jgi:hypothetical protein
MAKQRNGQTHRRGIQVPPVPYETYFGGVFTKEVLNIRFIGDAQPCMRLTFDSKGVDVETLDPEGNVVASEGFGLKPFRKVRTARARNAQPAWIYGDPKAKR